MAHDAAVARKQKLTRLQQHIVDQLSEAGSEEMTIVLNSLSQSGADYPAGADLLAAFEVALRDLITRRMAVLVRSDLRAYPPVEPAEVERLLALPRWLAWDATEARWQVIAGQVTGTIAIAAGGSDG
jgi:hypothetical protein